MIGVRTALGLCASTRFVNSLKGTWTRADVVAAGPVQLRADPGRGRGVLVATTTSRSKLDVLLGRWPERVQGLVTPDLNVPFPHVEFFEYVVGHTLIIVAALFLVVGHANRAPPWFGPARDDHHLYIRRARRTCRRLDRRQYMFLRHAPHQWTLLRLDGSLPLVPGHRGRHRSAVLLRSSTARSGSLAVAPKAPFVPSVRRCGLTDDLNPDPTSLTAPRLHKWNSRVVWGAVIASFASGFGQFGVVTALGSVARTFGHLVHGATLADQAGLSGTKLGVGLAIIRLASLGGLPLTAMADRFGRHRMLVTTVGLGLIATVLAAASPGYWWFVVIFACGRPLLSATNALSEVIAAEQTDTQSRAKALALVAAGYGVGAGCTAIIHSLASKTLGVSRTVLAGRSCPLALLPLDQSLGDRTGPLRHRRGRRRTTSCPSSASIGPAFRKRLILLSVLAFALSFITGPANSFIFLFAQNIDHLSGVTTALMVVGAGVTGLAGLSDRTLDGRSIRSSDHRSARHGRTRALRRPLLRRTPTST